ncbi:HAD-IIB family hydrolase [Endozoicomonas sp. 8E]|uniref:HAD-IIB family hydrolase n=1 Tax=Endozoicomonas sp. 8E TaxID=3035692 RepID=UPI002938D7F2|nr:HAD-IIB family hydrolase [Endozoicomonas sp. 8E]WOG28310.1 HAD-IIB family hydrolase [Endozoicomonas sp. 8E]
MFNSKKAMAKLVIFSDLDGTLLDHDSYSWVAAKPALDRLREQNIPVVFNTSKTLSEVLSLQLEMALDHPFITENGMITTIPAHYFQSSDTDKNTHYFHGQPYKAIRRVLKQFREQYGFRFRGFGDCSHSEIADLSGLDLEEAKLAADRKASEPLIWEDSDKALEQFEKQLSEEGLQLTRGGRFYHVSGKGDKGSAAKKLFKHYLKNFPEWTWISMGLGDSFNDLPMLEVVDIPVLVRSEKSKQPITEHLSNIKYTKSVGPEGWNEAVLEVLDSIQEGHEPVRSPQDSVIKDCSLQDG